MTCEQRFSAVVDGMGRIRADHPEAYHGLLNSLIGKRVNVEIRRAREKRTVEANRLLWGHVYDNAVAEGAELLDLSTGQPVFRTREDVHGWAKFMFLRRPVLTSRGELDLLGTTTTLTPQEFSEYVERVCATLANLGIYIPATR